MSYLGYSLYSNRMWPTIILATVVLNITLIFIHYLGPKAIIITWIPSRPLIIIYSIFHKKEILEWLKVVWASSITSILYLAIFHTSIRYLSKKRMPRFKCAQSHWIFTWAISILSIAGTTTLCYFTQNDNSLFIIGSLAAVINIINVLDAPAQLNHKPIKLTWQYFFFVNVMAIGVLILIQELIRNGHIRWAGISLNFPILAIALIAGSTCSNSPQAIRATSQHIYMLAYQSWPALGVVVTLWGTIKLGKLISMTLSSIVGILIVLGQYTMIKTKI